MRAIFVQLLVIISLACLLVLAGVQNLHGDQLTSESGPHAQLPSEGGVGAAWANRWQVVFGL